MSALIPILVAGDPASASAPSAYMAIVRVEIAWNAGYSTAPALRTWTDVTDYVELREGITITWGRSNERSSADANQLSLTLDNSDGRFTAGKTSGPYGSSVKLDRPIRVIADPVDGTETVRFLGFVNEWPVAWDGTDAYAKAPITASSRISRLGYTAGLKSIVEEAILDDSPLAYYTLSEAAGATQANDTSGNSATVLKTVGDPALPTVTFGNATGPGTDGLTAVEFAGGQYLSGPVAGAGTSTAYSLEAFLLRSGIPSVNEGVFGALQIDNEGIVVYIEAATGKLVCAGKSLLPTPPSLVTSTDSVADGAIHHVVVTRSATTLTVYLDGSLVGTVLVSGASIPALLTAGSSDVITGSLVPMTGVLAHFALFSSELSSTQAAAHANSGLTGYAGETLDVRADRYLAMANIPTTEINTEASNVLVQHIDTTDKQVVDVLRVLETTEAGALYDERDGTLTLHSRGHRYTTASSFTLDMAQQHVEADYQPTLERTYILNDVSAKDISGIYSARDFDPTSIADYGPMTASVETASTDDDAPLNHASWLVAAYKDPRVRVPSLGVDALAQVGKTPNCATVMAATVGTKITVSNHPAQAATSSATYFVEGGTEVYGPESLRITWNLSPSAPWDQVLVIGDASRGVIGTNMVAF